MLDFSLNDLLDPEKCGKFLTDILHPCGLKCPNGHDLDHCYVHKRDRAPILGYRCWDCGRCFNIFTGTVLQETKHNCVRLVQILRGIAQGVSTAQLARELGVSRPSLLAFRHKIQALALAALPGAPLPDSTVEADEMYQNAGEKRRAAPRSRGSPATTRQ